MKKESSKFNCQTGKIEEQVIYDVVMASLHAIILFSKGEIARQQKNSKVESGWSSALRRTARPCVPDDRETIHNKIRAAQLSIEYINLEKMTLWEDFHNGKMSRESFQNKSKQLSDKVERHEKNIAGLEAEATKTVSSDNNPAVERYNNLDGISALTKELVSDMVKEIRIYSPERVEIDWTYGDPLGGVFT
jgi:hypothetical protein